MKPYQTSFFDESKRLAALSRLGDPLEQISKHVEFEIFRQVLSEAFQKTDRKSPAGRKPLDVASEITMRLPMSESGARGNRPYGYRKGGAGVAGGSDPAFPLTARFLAPRPANSG